MVSAASVRGSDAVKGALIKAAAESLAEVGPRSLSVRDVARRAGVNHAQVHHYFGSKRALLEETMRVLAKDHYQHMKNTAHPDGLPRPLALAEDSLYWKSLCQTIIAGDRELAQTELEEGTSVPRDVYDILQQRAGGEELSLEMRARFAACITLVLGWVAFEDVMLTTAKIDKEDRREVRREVMKLVGEIMQLGDFSDD